MNVLDVPAERLIQELAKSFEKSKNIQPPVWAGFVKTGSGKERPPELDNWWYIRAAAILRSVYRLGPVGVSKLRSKYGSRKNKGAMPEKHYPGSGNIIRKILQQLEKEGLVKFVEKGVRKGRIVSKDGFDLLNATVKSISKSE